MPLNLTREFLNDLREAEDAKFVRRVLNHTIGEDGCFKPNKDDHRYHGIEDAWVRYVSRGTTAYRVIYIRKGNDLFLYRAGRHKVEDRLQPPSALSGALQIKSAPMVSPANVQQTPDTGCLLKTTEATFLSRYIQSMYHLKHNEIYIVSPFIDLPLLATRHHFGRFLDRAVEENTDVALVTSSLHGDNRLPAFKNLEERGISVFFLPRLHTKLYMFDIDLDSRNEWQQDARSTAIVGSSNLTSAGIGFDDVQPNEELCYALPNVMVDEVRTYVTRLTIMADDYKKHEFRMRRPKT